MAKSQKAVTEDKATDGADITQLRARFQKAMERRRNWLTHWQDCYEFALPQRNAAANHQTAAATP